jgi:hypothetical protein
MRNSNDTVGNRTRDLPTCSAVTQPTAPPRVPLFEEREANYKSGTMIKMTVITKDVKFPLPGHRETFCGGTQ